MGKRELGQGIAFLSSNGDCDHEARPFLAAKTALAAALAGSIIVTPAQAGIPVIDGGNLVQNVMTAIESVAQTLKQIEQYQTQLQQYENMLQNTMAPAAYIWDQAQSTINGLMAATDTLNYYRNQLGSIDAYLGKFQDVAYYRGSPCFSAAGCSDAERAAMEQNRSLASESQKKANDALSRAWSNSSATFPPMLASSNGSSPPRRARPGRCRPSATPTSSPPTRQTSFCKSVAC